MAASSAPPMPPRGRRPARSCAENSEAFVNTVRLTVPPDAELSKIAVHYLHNAAFAADKTTLRTGADGVSILFAVDMTQPYLD